MLLVSINALAGRHLDCAPNWISALRRVASVCVSERVRDMLVVVIVWQRCANEVCNMIGPL